MWFNGKIASGYDQEITQPQTADKPMAPPGRATQQSRDTRKTNQSKLEWTKNLGNYRLPQMELQ